MFEGQPKGLFALALANTGERFGYYTMLAVFALFLRANYGLSPALAGTIYSAFLMLVYFFPLIGGIMADKFGFGKMVTTGIMIMFAGYLLLSVPLGGDTTAYCAKFEAKAVEVGSTGTYKIEVALTAAAEAELEDEATTNVAVAVAAQLPTVAAAAVGSQTAIAVTGVVPGFYYSISYGTAVNAINTEGTRVLAPASGSITLQTPAKASGATTGFYRVNINVEQIPPPPPNSGE